MKITAPQLFLVASAAIALYVLARGARKTVPTTAANRAIQARVDDAGLDAGLDELDRQMFAQSLGDFPG